MKGEFKECPDVGLGTVVFFQFRGDFPHMFMTEGT